MPGQSALQKRTATRRPEDSRFSGAPTALDLTPNAFGVTPWSASAVFAIGYTPDDGQMYYVGADFYQSSDYGNTMGGPKGLPTESVVGVVKFAGYLWAMGASGKIYRATPTARDVALSWSAALLTPTTGAAGFAFALATDGTNYIYAGEYSDPTGQRPKIYRMSAADAAGAGTNWITVWQPTTACRHIHTIAPDPYAAGVVWACVGDGQGYELLRSTDYGATFTNFSTNAAWQAVQVSFDANYVYFAADTSRVSAFVYERATGKLFNAFSNWHGHIAAPGGAGARTITDGVVTGGNTLFKSAQAQFTADDVGRLLLGADGKNTVLPGNYIASVPSGNFIISGALASGTAITSIPVNASSTARYTGSTYTLPTGQPVTLAADYAANATSLTVNSVTPSSAVSSGATLTFVGSASATCQLNNRYSTTSVKTKILGDTFYKAAFNGAVDPSTGIYYFGAVDKTSGGTMYGIFAGKVGGRCELLDATVAPSSGPFYIAGGYMHWSMNRRPLQVPTTSGLTPGSGISP